MLRLSPGILPLLVLAVISGVMYGKCGRLSQSSTKYSHTYLLAYLVVYSPKRDRLKVELGSTTRRVGVMTLTMPMKVLLVTSVP